MLEYRLKNWKPAKPKAKKTKSSIRKEIVPDWLHKESKVEEIEVPEMSPKEIKEKRAVIAEQLKKLRKQS